MKKLLALLALFAANFSYAEDSKTKVIFTLDDIPMWFVTDTRERVEGYQKIRDVLAKHGIKSVVFVNAGFVNSPLEWSELSKWMDEGHVFGNHGAEHLPRGNVTERDFLVDLDHGEVLMNRNLPGWDKAGVRYYRYPNNDYGPSRDQIRTCNAIRSRRYFILPTSFNTKDYLWSERYHKAQGAEAHQLVNEAFQIIDAQFEQAKNLNMPLVMLMHSTRFTRDHLDEILTRLEQKGVEWVSPNLSLLWDYWPDNQCIPKCRKAKKCL